MPNWVTQKLTVDGSEIYFEASDFIRNLLTPAGEIDFNKIVPVPDELQIESSIMNVPCLRLYASRMVANGFASHEETEEFFKQLQVVANYFSRSSASLLVPADEDEAFIEVNALNDDIAAHIEFGKQCFNNIVKYGYMTWIDFTCSMWGTKWNGQQTFSDSNYVEYQTPDRPAIEFVDALAEQYPEYDFELLYVGEDVERSCCGKYTWSNGRRTGEVFYEAGSDEAYEVAFDLGTELREDYEHDSRGYHHRELEF